VGSRGVFDKLKMALLCSRVEIFFTWIVVKCIRQLNICNLLQLIEILLVSLDFCLISFFLASVMHGVRESQLAMHFTSTPWHILFVTPKNPVWFIAFQDCERLCLWTWPSTENMPHWDM
jgi:hypothetical protein